jgi:DNA-binding response OmpR family regulator
MDNIIMMRVLIVEDHKEYAVIIKMLVQQMGLEAIHAPTGEQAIELAKTQKPDLILLDLNLPGMTGWDVLKAIKEQYGEHGIPCIVSTAYTDPANRMVGKFQYVKSYITKPYELSELKTAIEAALELYKVGV